MKFIILASTTLALSVLCFSAWASDKDDALVIDVPVYVDTHMKTVDKTGDNNIQDDESNNLDETPSNSDTQSNNVNENTQRIIPNATQ